MKMIILNLKLLLDDVRFMALLLCIAIGLLFFYYAWELRQYTEHSLFFSLCITLSIVYVGVYQIYRKSKDD